MAEDVKVTTATPMKRGLKVPKSWSFATICVELQPLPR